MEVLYRIAFAALFLGNIFAPGCSSPEIQNKRPDLQQRIAELETASVQLKQENEMLKKDIARQNNESGVRREEKDIAQQNNESGGLREEKGSFKKDTPKPENDLEFFLLKQDTRRLEYEKAKLAYEITLKERLIQELQQKLKEECALKYSGQELLDILSWLKEESQNILWGKEILPKINKMLKEIKKISLAEISEIALTHEFTNKSFFSSVSLESFGYIV